MSIPIRPSASYYLWSLCAPCGGKKRWHCQMRRGFIKARQQEPQVKALSRQATPSQRIGLLAQKGIYEFHHNLHLLRKPDGVERVAKILKLNNCVQEVQKRVRQILQNYQNAPFLLGKRILLLSRGDEGFPKPIFVQGADYCFRLYAAMDCIFTESAGILHILDFKTGKSPFDRRQALVYLLAARYLYPGFKAIASFYNVEYCHQSEIIKVTKSELDRVEWELAHIAKKHQQDLRKYQQGDKNFSTIFPPNPGYHCHYCPFNSICEFSTVRDLT
ncbi:MAG: PD-(D/E)XK nuclease family protein [Calothrix sp. MO_192.B10]|nr:PD-(D/E)XK nuclease family protein [Calothrix sp. MO_192.B10]